MSKPLQLASAIGLLCLILAAILSEANAKPNSYPIKPRPVRDFVDALVELRRFLSNRFSPEQRCQRLAVVLDTMSKAPIDQFEIADIAAARKEEISRRLYHVNVEQLRNLYISAGRQYLERKIVDNSLIELLGCLKSGYHHRDSRARSFLSERELNTIIDQFQAISQQPLKLLIDGNNAQTGLNLHEFNDSIKNTVRNWIGDDRQKFDRLFQNPAVRVPQPPRKRPPVQAASQDAFQPPYQHMDPMDGYEGAFAAAGAFQQDVYPSGPIPSETTENDEDEEQEYLETVFGSLMTIYETLPSQAQLADRCQAYQTVIAAKREQVFSDGFVPELVKRVSARIRRQGPSRSVFRASRDTRQDFLFIVETFDPLRAGPEVWLDLNECLSQCANGDQDVALFLNSPEHLSLVQQVNAQLENESAQAYGQAGATFY